MSQPEPGCGDIWLLDLNPTKERDQAGKRPGVIISVDQFNHGPADLVIILPVSTKDKGILFHVRIVPPEGGVDSDSFIKCEDIRSISKERLYKKLGKITDKTMASIQNRIKILLGL